MIILNQNLHDSYFKNNKVTARIIPVAFIVEKSVVIITWENSDYVFLYALS